MDAMYLHVGVDHTLFRIVTHAGRPHVVAAAACALEDFTPLPLGLPDQPAQTGSGYHVAQHLVDAGNTVAVQR